VSKRDRLKLTPELTTRWATGNDNFVYSSLWDLNEFLHAVKSYDMGPSRFTSHPRGRCAADFYPPQKSIALAGFEPSTFESSGQHTNHYTTEATWLFYIML
jgi:hypothetical protein